MTRGRRLILAEAKATRTVRPEMAESMIRLKKSISGYMVEAVIVHLSGGEAPSFSSVRPGVRAATPIDLARIIRG